MGLVTRVESEEPVCTEHSDSTLVCPPSPQQLNTLVLKRQWRHHCERWVAGADLYCLSHYLPCQVPWDGMLIPSNPEPSHTVNQLENDKYQLLLEGGGVVMSL